MGALVDAECTHREDKRLTTALREAKLKLSSACIEDIDYSPKREIDRAQLRQLATCRWVAEHQNVIIMGHDRHREDLPRVCACPARVSQRATARSTDFADMARQLGFTRARVTQLMDLLLLAPEVQEEILFLEPRTAPGRPAAERARPARGSARNDRLAGAAA